MTTTAATQMTTEREAAYSRVFKALDAERDAIFQLGCATHALPEVRAARESLLAKCWAEVKAAKDALDSAVSA